MGGGGSISLSEGRRMGYQHIEAVVGSNFRPEPDGPQAHLPVLCIGMAPACSAWSLPDRENGSPDGRTPDPRCRCSPPEAFFHKTRHDFHGRTAQDHRKRWREKTDIRLLSRRRKQSHRFLPDGFCRNNPTRPLIQYLKLQEFSCYTGFLSARRSSSEKIPCIFTMGTSSSIIWSREGMEPLMLSQSQSIRMMSSGAIGSLPSCRMVPF